MEVRMSHLDGNIDDGNVPEDEVCFEEDQEIEIDESKYPNLVLKINKRTLKGLVHEIVQLSEEFPNEYSLQYETVQGKCWKMKIMPQIKSKDSFQKIRRNMLKDIAENTISKSKCRNRIKNETWKDKESIENEEKSLVVSWIIDNYCKNYKDIFEEVTENHGYDMKYKEMSTEMAAAMFSEANVGATASRVINKYICMPREKNNAITKQNIPWRPVR